MLCDTAYFENLKMFVNALLTACARVEKRCGATFQYIERRAARGQATPELLTKLSGVLANLQRVLSLVTCPCLDLMKLLAESKPAPDYLTATAIAQRAQCGWAVFSALLRCEAYLAYFTVELLEFNKKSIPDVTEVLMRGNWLHQQNRKLPLPFVKASTRDLQRRIRRASKGKEIPFSQLTNPENLKAATDDMFEGLLGVNPWAEIHAMQDLEKTLSDLGMPGLTIDAAVARYQLAPSSPGRYDQQEIADYLASTRGIHVNIQQLEAAHKHILRRQKILRQRLKSYVANVGRRKTPNG